MTLDAARLTGTQRQAMPPVYMRPNRVNTTATTANTSHTQVVHVGRRSGGGGMAPPSEKVRDITLLLSTNVGASIVPALGGRNDPLRRLSGDALRVPCAAYRARMHPLRDHTHPDPWHHPVSWAKGSSSARK